MPVGTSFENSAIQPAAGPLSNNATNEQKMNVGNTGSDSATAVKQRDLTKQRKTPPPEQTWRRSWGSTASDQKNEFWMALQENYDFIMNNQLIENCQMANNELGEIIHWSVQEFYSQFSDLYLWLNKVQDDISDCQDANNQTKADFMTRLNRKQGVLKLFNQQACVLRSAQPEELEDIDWRVSHLNSKWESIETALKPSASDKCEVETDVDKEIDCLNKWLKTMEDSIQEVNLWVRWSLEKIEQKRLKHKKLHEDIQNHGRIVRSVVKRCKQRAESNADVGDDPGVTTTTTTSTAAEPPNTACAADRNNAVIDVEQRWYALCLRSHEWQCFIETLAKREPPADTDYDELDDSYADTNMNPCSNDTKSMSTEASSEPPTLSLFANENPKFNHSDRKGPNLGTFYFKHEDTDSDMDKGRVADANDAEVADVASTVSDNESLVDDTPATTTDDDDNVRRLVSQADHLIQPQTTTTNPNNHHHHHRRNNNTNNTTTSSQRDTSSVNSATKLNRVKQWLDMGEAGTNTTAAGQADNGNSCDASAEEDEDHEDEEEVDDSTSEDGGGGEVAGGGGVGGKGAGLIADDSSEELNESIATTCRLVGQHFAAAVGSQNTSFDDLGLAEHAAASTPKVTMRPKAAISRTRPLSDFGVSQLTDRFCDKPEGFSISESALNQLTLGGGKKPLNASSLQCVEMGVGAAPPGNNSTSSTVEDTAGGAMLLEDKPGGARRKRIKSKKKSMLRKSGEISSPANSHGSGGGVGGRPLIRKSGSFSGQGCGISGAGAGNGGGPYGGNGGGGGSSDRHAVSDPSALHRPYGAGGRSRGSGGLGVDTMSTTTSGQDSEDDKRVLIKTPMFKLGCKTNYRSNDLPPPTSQRSSLNTGEEQFSSMSEQAWDPFQEKYSSEAYSEAHDSDGARRFMELDEDYRNYLDSQSDWSCQSGLKLQQLQRHRQQQLLQQQQQQQQQQQSFAGDLPAHLVAAGKSRISAGGVGSAASVAVVMARSQLELREVEGIVDAQFREGGAGLREVCAPTTPCELLVRCDTNIGQLERLCRSSSRRSSTQKERPDHLDQELDDAALDSTVLASDCTEVIQLSKTELIAAWEAVRERVERMREYHTLDNRIRQLRYALGLMAEAEVEVDPPSNRRGLEHSVTSTEDISMKIDIYSSDRANLIEQKKMLFDLNLAVHQFRTKHKEFDTASVPLKADIADLYGLWTHLDNSTSEKLTKLKSLLQSWQMLETRLEQLRGDLREDEHTLGVLDSAFEEGAFDREMAASARGVARLLSETKLQGIPPSFASANLLLSQTTIDGGGGGGSGAFSCGCGGTYSDSGISDEGSEHEPGERERRLAAIRRLVRQLEHIVTPESIANVRMQERLAAAEEDLKALRTRCRSLMTRSGTMPVEEEEAGSTRAVQLKSVGAPGGGDPDHGRSGPRPISWYRRVMRASIPFQLALVCLVCFMFLFKPQCCDNMNTYTLSLRPQLHYMSGPPPM